jgi:hypothetical protein
MEEFQDSGIQRIIIGGDKAFISGVSNTLLDRISLQRHAKNDDLSGGSSDNASSKMADSAIVGPDVSKIRHNDINADYRAKIEHNDMPSQEYCTGF